MQSLLYSRLVLVVILPIQDYAICLLKIKKSDVMKCKTLTLLVLIFYSLHVNAEVINTPEAAVPKNLHVYDDNGQTYVDHVSGECTQKRYRLDPTHPKYDAIVSILLAAKMSEKEVVLRYDYNATCTQGRIVGVYLP